MSPAIEIPLIAAVTAAACALPGTFVVLQKLGLLADAIGHTVLLGIVLAFFAGADLGSPWLVFGAAMAGMATAGLVSLIQRRRHIPPDAAIGLVFPTLFAAAVVLVSQFAAHVHLDTDAVLLGMLELAPLERVRYEGMDFGPRALLIMTALLALNVIVITLLYKEFQLSTFDPGLALAAGISPLVMQWALMGLVSVTAVGAFEVVGGVLVVAFMVGPPATALLLVKRLGAVLWLSPLLGLVGALGGVSLARLLDANLAGSMAFVQAILFGIAVILAPGRGMLAMMFHRRRIRREFHLEMLLVHLSAHSGTERETVECTASHLTEHLGWNRAVARDTLNLAQRKGLIRLLPGGIIRPTIPGIKQALEGATR